eukprot:78538_1
MSKLLHTLLLIASIIHIDHAKRFSIAKGNMIISIIMDIRITTITLTNNDSINNYQWMGIGFDSLKMNNTYSIVWNTFDGVNQYILGHHTLLGRKLNINNTINNTYLRLVSQTTNDKMTTVVIERDNHLQNTSYYYSHIFSSFTTEMDVIFAYGKSSDTKIQKHDNKNKYCHSLLSVATTSMPKSTQFNDTNITKTTLTLVKRQQLFGTTSHVLYNFIGIGIIFPISLLFIRNHFSSFIQSNVYFGEVMRTKMGGAGIIIGFVMIIFGFLMRFVDFANFTIQIFHHLFGIILIIIFGSVLLFEYTCSELFNSQSFKSIYITVFIICGFLQMISGAYIWRNYVFVVILILFLCLWSVLFLCFEIMKFKQFSNVQQIPAKDISDDETEAGDDIQMVNVQTNEHNNNTQNNDNEQVDDSEESDLLIVPDYKPTPR